MSESDPPSINTDGFEKNPLLGLNCKLLKDSPLNLTFEKAEEFLSLATFKDERPVADNHVQELYDEMANGRFRGEHVRMAQCLVTAENVTFRINGQHTAWARLSMPKKYDCWIRYLEYSVPGHEDLKKLYSTFDPQYSSRSAKHLTRLLLSDTAAVEGLSSNIIGHLAVGYKFWKWGEEGRRQGPNEVAVAIQKEHELFIRVGRFVSPFFKTPHIGHRSGVIAAMFECFSRRPTFAEEFWKPVCDRIGLSTKTDARYALMTWLERHGIDIAPTGRRGKLSTKSEEMYRVSINAWNKWRAGEAVNQLLRGTERRVNAK